MKRWVNWFDDVVISGFQLYADLIHKYTGFDCLHQARATYFIYCLFLGLSMPHWILIALPIFSAGVNIMVSLDTDNIIRELASLGYRNIRRPNWQKVRVMLFFLAAFCVASFRYTPRFMPFAIYFFWISMNLDSCELQPPTRGKFREWLDTFKQQPLQQTT